MAHSNLILRKLRNACFRINHHIKSSCQSRLGVFFNRDSGGNFNFDEIPKAIFGETIGKFMRIFQGRR